MHRKHYGIKSKFLKKRRYNWCLYIPFYLHCHMTAQTVSIFLTVKVTPLTSVSLIKFYSTFASTLIYFVEALEINALPSINEIQSLLKRINYIFRFINNS